MSGNRRVDILASPDLLEHVPPLGTLSGPALDDVVVVAQVGEHQTGVLVEELTVKDRAQVGTLGGSTDSEEGRGRHGVRGVSGVAHELDELLGSINTALILAVKDAEAPDAAAELSGAAVRRGEVHVNNLLPGDGLAFASAGRVGIDLLGAVPAEGHLQHALVELGDLVAAGQRSVVVDALSVTQLGEGLDVLGIVPGVSSVVGIGVGAAIEVVDEGAGALVTALACAVHSGHSLAEVAVESVNGLEEVLSGPGAGGQIDVLIGTSRLEGVQVDGHAVGGHAHGILIHLALSVDAGGQSGLDQLALVGIVQHVGKVHHVAVGAPVGNQTLRPFQNQVGRVAGGEGGVDLVIAVGIGQIVHLDGNAGLGSEGVSQCLDVGLFAPAAYGVDPQGDLTGPGGLGGSGVGSLVVLSGFGAGSGIGIAGGRVVLVASAGNQSHGHDHGKQQCKQLLDFHG